LKKLAEVYTQWIEGYEDFKTEEITSSKCVSLIERMEEESDKFREFSTQLINSSYVFISAITTVKSKSSNNPRLEGLARNEELALTKK